METKVSNDNDLIVNTIFKFIKGDLDESLMEMNYVNDDNENIKMVIEFRKKEIDFQTSLPTWSHDDVFDAADEIYGVLLIRVEGLNCKEYLFFYGSYGDFYYESEELFEVIGNENFWNDRQLLSDIKSILKQYY